jgi:hypothetical protein
MYLIIVMREESLLKIQISHHHVEFLFGCSLNKNNSKKNKNIIIMRRRFEVNPKLRFGLKIEKERKEYYTAPK